MNEVILDRNCTLIVYVFVSRKRRQSSHFRRKTGTQNIVYLSHKIAGG